MDKYIKLKHLLEYFVSHLEWVQNNVLYIGYKQYIEPILDSFVATGHGYNEDSIQKQVENWSGYADEICINETYRYRKYTTSQCYLNWKGTWTNIRPKWNKNKHIEGYYLTKQEKA